MKRSITLRIFFLHFFVLALPLYLATCIFFEKFYVRAVEVARHDLKSLVEYKQFSLSALQPISMEALEDISLLVSDNKSEMKQQIDALNHSSSHRLLTALELPLTEQGGYALLDQQQLFGLKEFISGGGIEEILSQGQARFIRYIVLPHGSPLLLFIVGHVMEKKNQTIGVLLSSANVEDSIHSILQDRDDTVSLALLNPDSVVLASTDPLFHGQYFESLTAGKKKQLMDSGAIGNVILSATPVFADPTREPGFYDFIFQGKKYLGYRTHDKNAGFELLAFIPKQSLFLLALKEFIWIYIAYLVVLILGIILAYILSRLITRPLHQLSHVMGEAHEGNLRARFIKDKFGFEINELGSLFNHALEALVTKIKKAEDERVNKEKYLREVAIGREVQKNLSSTRITQRDKIEVAALYLQAENVGGDFYYAESLGEDKVWMAVGDAAGKGISACLYSLTVRSLMRTYVNLYQDVGKVLYLTNKMFLEHTEDSGMFVTTLMGLFDFTTSTLSYNSCGHLPGIVRRKDGSLIALQHSGMALGLLESEETVPDHIALQPGDIVIFYTKGFIEGMNGKHQPFSYQRLKNLLQQRKWTTAQQIVDGLHQEYQNFIGSIPQDDEAVVLAFRMLEG